jgi:hypothetical protein
VVEWKPSPAVARVGLLFADWCHCLMLYSPTCGVHVALIVCSGSSGVRSLLPRGLPDSRGWKLLPRGLPDRRGWKLLPRGLPDRRGHQLWSTLVGPE